jgi:hypothetical protein
MGSMLTARIEVTLSISEAIQANLFALEAERFCPYNLPSILNHEPRTPIQKLIKSMGIRILITVLGYWMGFGARRQVLTVQPKCVFC